jgi:predicted phosphodiesterase
MSVLWTDIEKSFVRDQVKGGADATTLMGAISEKVKLGTFGFPAKRSLVAVKKKMKELEEEPEDFEAEAGYKTELTELEFLYGRYKESYRESKPLVEGNARFILSLSDLHIPFCPPARIKEILEAHAADLKENGVIVLNGDIMDQYGASTFTKFKEVNLLQEYRATFELVKLCTEYASRVVLVRGNHEKRLGRLVRDKLPSSATSVIETDLLSRIANGEKLNSFGDLVGVDLEMKAKVSYSRSDAWFQLVGKTIFCHPSFYSGSSPGATVAKAAEHFVKRGYVPMVDFDSIVCGHTHHQYKGVVNDILLIEQGSLAGRLGYEGGDDLNMGFGQQGYAWVWQDASGSTNWNDSNFYSFGRYLPKKKRVVG